MGNEMNSVIPAMNAEILPRADMPAAEVSDAAEMGQSNSGSATGNAVGIGNIGLDKLDVGVGNGNGSKSVAENMTVDNGATININASETKNATTVNPSRFNEAINMKVPETKTPTADMQVNR